MLNREYLITNYPNLKETNAIQTNDDFIALFESRENKKSR